MNRFRTGDRIEDEEPPLLTTIRIGGYVVGAMLYCIVTYTIWMCMQGNNLQSVVMMNTKGEAWWEVLQIGRAHV